MVSNHPSVKLEFFCVEFDETEVKQLVIQQAKVVIGERDASALAPKGIVQIVGNNAGGYKIFLQKKES